MRLWPIGHGLKPAEYQRFVALLGRTPTFTELGIVSAMWNEHCSYKSSRLHLRKLPTRAPWVIQGPGENAGVIDIGDGEACVFKMESHNHPSFIEPYQGAATGVGGILRDVFTMGARPIGRKSILVLLFTTGLITMAMELIWIRLFTPFIGPLVYSFALILASYLLATFIGSRFYRKWSLDH